MDCQKVLGVRISIHALREESDVRCKNLILGQQISIHALREESDKRKILDARP